jgi:cysteine desulfurase
MIYFDNAATTPLHPEVKEAMISAMEVFGNPASIHQLGRKGRVLLENQRTNVSILLGGQPGEIIFTSGGTESLQTVLASAVMNHGVTRIISSPLEHPAVLKNLTHLEGTTPLEVVRADFDATGRIDLAHLESLMPGEKKTMVVLMHANNETGMLLPMKKVASLCREHQVLFLSDTVQTMGKFAGNPAEGASFAAASAHKFHGPKGVGLLYMNGDMPVQPLIRGGG